MNILCNECKNEFQEAKPRTEAQASRTGGGAKLGDKVQCPTCGTTLTIISVDEPKANDLAFGGLAKTRPVSEEK